MNYAERELALIERYRWLPDVQELFSAWMDQAQGKVRFTAQERLEENRVLGCQSAVWLLGERDEEDWRFRCDAESPLVRGLVQLLCDLYSDLKAVEVQQATPAVFIKLEVWPTLSRTRQEGLLAVCTRLRELAAC
jgi:cysteine desulfuration protein SufE